jgi:proliferating cell nuclear antigen
VFHRSTPKNELKARLPHRGNTPPPFLLVLMAHTRTVSKSSAAFSMGDQTTFSDNIFTACTLQVGPMRMLATALKEILIETNASIRPDGIHITNMDKSHTIAVDLFLPAGQFEFYECKQPLILVGLKLSHLFMVLNMMRNNDVLTMCLANGDYSDGVVSRLTFRFDDGLLKQRRIYYLNSIDAEGGEVDFPHVEYPCKLRMPSSDFQMFVHDAGVITDKVEIWYAGGEIGFRGVGPVVMGECTRGENPKTLDILTRPDDHQVIQGVFSVKTLGFFIKCTGLCGQVELSMQNDMPLMAKYDVADLGVIQLAAVPLPSVAAS